MIEFVEASNGEPIFINPDLVEAVTTVPPGPGRQLRAGIKLASGKEYDVEGNARDVTARLFPGSFSVQRLSPSPR